MNRRTLFNIAVNSKNKTFTHHFLSFFKKYLTYNPIILAKYQDKKVNRKTITLLKSPHVHKSSQEHFKNKNFKKYFKIKAQKNLKLLFFLKGLSYKMFPSSNVKIKQLLNNKNLSKDHLNIINLNNFSVKLLTYKTIKTKNLQLKIGLNSFKKNQVISPLVSKKINLAFSTLQLYCDSQCISPFE
jgi:ribosomal protein S10